MIAVESKKSRRVGSSGLDRSPAGLFDIFLSWLDKSVEKNGVYRVEPGVIGVVFVEVLSDKSCDINKLLFFGQVWHTS